MSVSAEFYQFSKRRNSTKVPASAGTTINVDFKRPTSRRAPVLNISAASFDFNYCKMEGRYYFITDITSIRDDLWEVAMYIDVLATYKTEILAGSAFVLYDPSANTEIVDDRLAVKTTPVFNRNVITLPGITGYGSYVLSVIGKGGTDSWVLPSTTNLTNLITAEVDNIFGPVPPTQPTIIEQVQMTLDYMKQVFVQFFSSQNAPECVRSCYWVPWDVSGSNGRIYLGDFDTGVDGGRIGYPIQNYSVQVSIPWQATDWRRNSPYHQVYLYLPFIGVINIPPASIIDDSALAVKYSLNKLNGDISVEVSGGATLKRIGMYAAHTGITIPIGVSNVSPAQIFNSLLSGAGIVAAAGSAGIAGSAAIAGLTAAARGALIGHPSSVGGGSGGAASGGFLGVECYTIFHDTNVAPTSVAATIGTPTFAAKTISSISGYMQAREFSMPAAAFGPDYDEVNNYINTGVFIE